MQDLSAQPSFNITGEGDALHGLVTIYLVAFQQISGKQVLSSRRVKSDILFQYTQSLFVLTPYVLKLFFLFLITMCVCVTVCLCLCWFEGGSIVTKKWNSGMV